MIDDNVQHSAIVLDDALEIVFVAVISRLFPIRLAQRHPYEILLDAPFRKHIARMFGELATHGQL